MRLRIAAAVAVTIACVSLRAAGAAGAQPAGQVPGGAARAREAGAAFPVFDGRKALEHLRAQVAFGPRVPGTEAHARCREYLTSVLKPLAGRLDVQTFRAEHPRFPGGLALTNIVAGFGVEAFPEARRRLTLVAHWDCRPWSDESPDPKDHTLPVPGANDGASGVAVLLELARLLEVAAPTVGVDIVLVDGEDLGTDDFPRGWCMGSKYYVFNLHDARPMGAIVLDMVGDSDLSLPVEANSQANAPWLVEKLWSAAARAGHRAIFDRAAGPAVYDDHMPFALAGIPAVDVIDYDYPAWHTPGDDLSKVSAASLAAVGEALVALLYGGRLR